MDDQIAFVEFAEIDLGAVTLGATQLQTPARMDCESSKQFRSRENDEIGRRENKIRARACLRRNRRPSNGACHDFAEALDLAFSLKINDDSRVVRAPFFQALDELRAFRLGEHEIAGAQTLRSRNPEMRR